jgi:CysZ protein
VIWSSFSAALGQLGDRRFLRVMALGVGLSLALLLGVYGGFVQVVNWLTPDTLTLPWVGQVHWVKDLLGWGSLVLMIGLSVFLMVPVAALFTSFFLDDVAKAVEERHYPGLRAVPHRRLVDGLIASVNFFGLLILVNIFALLGYFLVGPFAPLMFWAVNGYLLGREYFETVALRRMDRKAARALRKRNSGIVWLAGVLMAAPLSLPFINLLIPVLGVATFTHLFHQITNLRPPVVPVANGRTSQDREW